MAEQTMTAVFNNEQGKLVRISANRDGPDRDRFGRITAAVPSDLTNRVEVTLTAGDYQALDTSLSPLEAVKLGHMLVALGTQG